MANYRLKEFKFYLSKDKKFMEKLNQCQNDLSAGRVGFFVSMQTLIGYTSFKFLNSLIIENSELKNKFFKMNSKTGDINSIETLKLLCKVLNRMNLFNTIEETGLNDYANVDKHSKIYVPFDGDVANACTTAFNQFIVALERLNKFVDAENCKIKELYSQNNNKTNKPAKKEKKPVDPATLRKNKYEELIKDEYHICSQDFYLGNSKWRVNIIEMNYDCHNTNKGLFGKLLNTYKGTCKRTCVMRLTLLNRNDESIYPINIKAIMNGFSYEEKYTNYYNEIITRETNGCFKKFSFKDEYQSERFSLCDEVNNLTSKPLDKAIKFCIINTSADEKYDFTYDLKKLYFKFD